MKLTQDQVDRINAILKRGNKVELRPKHSTNEVLVVEVETTVVDKIKND